MYKFVTLFALVACTVAAPAPSNLLAQPLFAAGPAVAVAHAVPAATSYASTVKIDKSAALVAHAPVITQHAAVAYHAPVVAHAAPIVHTPLVHQAAYSVHPSAYSYGHHGYAVL